MIVDLDWYLNVYMGQEADAASFPPLCSRAEDVIAGMTHGRVTPETFQGLHPMQKTLFKKAVCAQIDYFAVNGLDSVAGGTDRGFTVGKVSVSGKSGSDLVRRGVMAQHISPMAVMYLEQSGLMNPQVATVPHYGGWL